MGFPSQSTDTSQEAEDEAVWPHFTRVDRTKTRGVTHNYVHQYMYVCMYVYIYMHIVLYSEYIHIYI